MNIINTIYNYADVYVSPGYYEPLHDINSIYRFQNHRVARDLPDKLNYKFTVIPMNIDVADGI